MKLFKGVYAWMTIVILAGTYLPQTPRLFLLLGVLALLLIKNKFKLALNMPGEKIYLLLFLWGGLLGVIKIFLDDFSIYEVLKHAYYYVILFLYWHIGEQLIREKKIDRKKVIRTILVNAVFISLVDILVSISRLAKANGLGINSFRNLMGVGNIISLIGVYLCLIYKEEINYTRKKRILAIVICFISSIIHFSRMMLLYCLIFILVSKIKIISTKWIKYMVMAIFGVGIVAIAFPELTQLYINKIMDSFTEINFKLREWNDITITNNWRGYEVSCAIEQFKNSSVFNQLFGTGFGTTLDVKGYAYLVTDENTLSFLHNGYFTQLLIWGIFGIIFFFLWILSMLKQTCKMILKKDRQFVRALIMVILAANYFVMGPFFSETIASYFFYISLVYGLNKKICTN